MLTLALGTIAVVPTLAHAQSLRIYHLDVEQAEATLFVSPSGNTLLVDSGKNGHGDRLRAVMQAAGVTQIDHFVATHYHEDHFGGIDDLTNAPAITIVNGYDRGDKGRLPSSKTSQGTYVDYQAAIGNRAEQLTRGETIPLDPAMTVTCVASGGVVLGEEPPVHGNHENDMSVALLIQFAGFRYFIGGDIENTTEGKLASRDVVMNIDVYQANHHGSHTSSSLAFVQDLAPTVVVISNGNHGGFRHPRQHTLNTFTQLSPAPSVFQTNKYLKGGDGGNVPDAFIADVETTGTDGTILLAVDGASGTYTVTYGTTSQSFNTRAPAGHQVAQVAILSLVPDPVGIDRDLESVTLRNTGSAGVALAGWTLRDASGRVWNLAGLGTLAGGAQATIQRAGMPMSLNNGGDTIELVDAAGSTIQTVTYGPAAEDEVCTVQADGSAVCQ